MAALSRQKNGSWTSRISEGVTDMTVRAYNSTDIPRMAQIWNEVVEQGEAFPQTEKLSEETAREFFAAQSYCGVCEDGGELVGLYILHPNNVGRCGHIANASYAVRTDMRGRRIGEQLVSDCIKMCGELGFGILQFNAVVSTNAPALRLYKKLGFTQLGTIPHGFRRDDGTYADIIPHYIEIIKR